MCISPLYFLIICQKNMLNRHLNTIFDKHIESKNCTNSAIHYVHIILSIVITTNLHLQVPKFLQLCWLPSYTWKLWTILKSLRNSVFQIVRNLFFVHWRMILENIHHSRKLSNFKWFLVWFNCKYLGSWKFIAS